MIHAAKVMLFREKNKRKACKIIRFRCFINEIQLLHVILETIPDIPLRSVGDGRY